MVSALDYNVKYLYLSPGSLLKVYKCGNGIGSTNKVTLFQNFVKYYKH